MQLLSELQAAVGSPTYRPQNLEPLDGATGVLGSAALTGDAYYGLYDIPQGSREFQVDFASGDFSSPVAALTVLPSSQGSNDALSAAVSDLQTATSYMWRYRDVTAKGDYGDWSEATGFSTAATFGLAGVYTQLNGGPITGERSSAAAAHDGAYDAIYVLAGGPYTASSGGVISYPFWRYIPATNTWQKLPDVSAYAEATLIAIGEKLYSFGGAS